MNAERQPDQIVQGRNTWPTLTDARADLLTAFAREMRRLYPSHRLTCAWLPIAVLVPRADKPFMRNESRHMVSCTVWALQGQTRTPIEGTLSCVARLASKGR